MPTEQEYFEYFKEHQLKSVNFDTGTINVFYAISNRHRKVVSTGIATDVGSLSEDGYSRVWCGSKRLVEYYARLKMKHRLLYYLYYGSIPEGLEIDHIDRNRDNNGISNLRAVTRIQNCNNSNIHTNRSKFTESDIHKVCRLLQTSTLSDLTIAKSMNMSRNYVRDIKKRRRRKKISSLYSWDHRE